jgi:hypothetical protein
MAGKKSPFPQVVTLAGPSNLNYLEGVPVLKIVFALPIQKALPRQRRGFFFMPCWFLSVALWPLP